MRILSDLDSREQRLRSDISQLQGTLSQLGAGAQGREAALAEARRAGRRARHPGRHAARGGPGLQIQLRARADRRSAPRPCWTRSRSCAAPAPRRCRSPARPAAPVRIVASTSFVDGPATASSSTGVLLDRLVHDHGDRAAPTMRTALTIPGGVVRRGRAATAVPCIVDEPASVTVDALHPADRRCGTPSRSALSSPTTEGLTVIPEDLRYTAEHEWVAPPQASRCRAGRHHRLRAGRARRHRLRAAARGRHRGRGRRAVRRGRVDQERVGDLRAGQRHRGRPQRAARATSPS